VPGNFPFRNLPPKQLKWWYAIFFESFKILYSHLGRREDLSLSTNRLPLRELLRGPNRWKSEGAKSGLWAGCLRTSQFSFLNGVDGKSVVWGRAFSCNETTPCDDCPLYLMRMAALSSSLNMSQQFTLVTVVALSILISKLGHWDSHNTVNKCLLVRSEKWIFWKKEQTCASIACSAVRFLVHINESRFRHQW
jgi:hypothetical protein